MDRILPYPIHVLILTRSRVGIVMHNVLQIYNSYDTY